MRLTTKNYLLLLLSAICISTGCHKKPDIGKASVVFGRVYVYGTDEPLSNHLIYLYGSYGSGGTIFDYKMAETTTDGNGNYRFDYEVVDGVIPRQTWLPGSETESFNETQAITNPNFSQFNSCYVQGPPPNSSSYTLGYHTTVKHDIVLYPYAKLTITPFNDNYFDPYDELEIWIDSDLQDFGYTGVTSPFHFIRFGSDSGPIIHHIFNSSRIKYNITHNNVTTGPFYDTLTFNMCDEVNYEIHY